MSVEIEIKDKGERKGFRSLVANIKTDSEALRLADVLSQHGALLTLEDYLKETLEREVNQYIKNGSEFIKKLASANGVTRNT